MTGIFNSFAPQQSNAAPKPLLGLPINNPVKPDDPTKPRIAGGQASTIIGNQPRPGGPYSSTSPGAGL